MTSLDPPTLSGDWMDAAAVVGILPHRYPFLLVDRLRIVEPGRRAFGLKRVTGAEWCGAGTPVDGAMPGLLIVEALAQTSAAVLVGLLDREAGAIGYFAAMQRVRFRAPATPGDTLMFSIELRSFRRSVAHLRGEATVDGRLAVSAEFKTVVRAFAGT